MNRGCLRMNEAAPVLLATVKINVMVNVMVNVKRFEIDRYLEFGLFPIFRMVTVASYAFLCDFFFFIIK